MAWMLMAAMLLFGAICFSRMGLAQMPDVDFPVVNVSITLPNAAPEVVESDVSDVVEQAVLGVEGVQDVQSVCTQGQANITVYLDISRPVDAAVQDVQTLVASVQKQLPTNVYPAVIRKQNPNSSPIIWFAVTVDPPLTVKDMMLYTRDHIEDHFTSLPGVSTVSLGGFMNREVNIWVDNNKLNARQLTVQDLIDTIDHQHDEVPAGSMETPELQYDIRSMGEAYTVPAFGDLPIITRGGAPNYSASRLKDVATIEDGIVSPTVRLSRFNGITAVGLGIVMQDGYNAVQVADLAKQRMAEVQKLLPPGYHIAVNFDTTTFIRDNVHELELTICLAALLTGLVCFLFLGSWTSTLNVFLAIPTSLFGTMMIIYFFGFTLNTFTLLALSLSIGVVVDDAIMVLENIVRHQEKGEDQVEAALKGAREVTFAAVATSIAIVAIFLPIAFMQGVIGKFFFQFGLTLSGAVLISLLEAITLTPMRCAEFVHRADEHSPFNHFVNTQFHRLTKFYTRVLTWALDHRWLVLIISFAVFLTSLFSFTLIKKEFVPVTDQSVFIVNLKLPVQYSLSRTDGVVKQCEAALHDRGEIKNLYAAVGGFGTSATNTGILFVTMKPPGDRPVVSEELSQGKGKPKKKVHKRLTQMEFSQLLRSKLSKVSPDLQVSIQDLSQRGMSTGKGYAAEFLVTGPDWDVLSQSVQAIRAKLKADTKLADVTDNFLDGQPEIRIIPDRVKAAQMGVNMDDLGNVVGSTIGGYTFQGIYFHEGGHDNPILIRVPEDQRQVPADINHIYVRNNRGEVLPVSAVSSLAVTTALQQITRDMRAPSVYFYANAGPGTSQAEALKEATSVAQSCLPATGGYSVQLTGSSQANSGAFSQLGIVMILGIVVAYMVLGSQFNSFIQPVVILLALPFSITGAFFSLLVTGQTINMYSFIGIILLLGLVKKNSIMLVDFTNQRRRLDGMNVHEALLAACPIRFRPILMTSAATMAGALPAALAWGPGAELRQGMSVAIIGGMFFSTILTLVVVPCAYSLMSNLERPGRHQFELDEHGNLVAVKTKTPIRRGIKNKSRVLN
jgi:HAE1 family hydrophobic/amphiphilic exporter-1